VWARPRLRCLASSSSVTSRHTVWRISATPGAGVPRQGDRRLDLLEEVLESARRPRLRQSPRHPVAVQTGRGCGVQVGQAFADASKAGSKTVEAYGRADAEEAKDFVRTKPSCQTVSGKSARAR
jgi:hypothetical protein